MTSISKTSVLKEDNLAIIGKSFKNKNEYGLTAEQVTYIEKQIADGKKFVAVNQFTRFVFVVLLDDKKETAQFLGQRIPESLFHQGIHAPEPLHDFSSCSAILFSA